MLSDQRTRATIVLRVVSVLLPSLALVGALGWWLTGHDTTYFLNTSDARGLQPGDGVIRNGVRVGEVVGVRAADQAARVEFRMASGEKLIYVDLVRVDRALMSATAQIELTRGCDSTAEGDGAIEVPRGRVVEEASRMAVLATRANCSDPARRIRRWLDDVDTDRAVAAFTAAVNEVLVAGQEASSAGIAELRAKGEELTKKLREAGLPARADSIREIMAKRLQGY